MSDYYEVIAEHLYTEWCKQQGIEPEWEDESAQERALWRGCEAKALVDDLLEAGFVIEERFKGAEL
jgi:hypothetical protein